ncbi:MAG: serine hydrolase domain-containing protein, partial [Gaiella sp.]
LLATAQAEQRVPSVSAAVFRDGGVLWQGASGLADVASGEEATPEHTDRIGSITKTFTAVAVLQLRDAGALALSQPLQRYVGEAPAGPTVAEALSHLSGLQREPVGDIWESMAAPAREDLLAGLDDAERVLEPGRAWHYSNLVFGLLGELVGRDAKMDVEKALRIRLLGPLELTRTEFVPSGPTAKGYFVDPYSDLVHEEVDPAASGPMAAVGWLWSTTSDLARWGDFLATGADGVLACATLDEMSRVRTMVDEVRWTVGWGLGLCLYRRGERVYAGHGGAMPGFLASLVVNRPERTGAVALMSTSAGGDPETLALDLADATLDAMPRLPKAWKPDEGPPAEIAPLLGRWWSEGLEHVVAWNGGRLRIELLDGPAGRDVSWLRPEGEERWRVEEGRELGELLRLVRDDAGAPTKLYFATYPMTRVASTFGTSASA